MSDELGTRPRHPVATSLTDLVAWLGGQDAEVSTRGDLGSREITGLSLSSQRIRPGDLYAALPGARAHGIGFAADAIAAGAVAVLTDPDGADAADPLGVPLLVVERPRALLGRLSARIHDLLHANAFPAVVDATRERNGADAYEDLNRMGARDLFARAKVGVQNMRLQNLNREPIEEHLATSQQLAEVVLRPLRVMLLNETLRLEHDHRDERALELPILLQPLTCFLHRLSAVR